MQEWISKKVCYGRQDATGVSRAGFLFYSENPSSLLERGKNLKKRCHFLQIFFKIICDYSVPKFPLIKE